MCRSRKLIQSVLLALIVASVTGCAAPLAPSSPTSEPITLRFAYLQEEKGEAYEKLSAEFHDTHPNITVEVQQIEDLSYVTSEGSQIDVFETSQFNLVSLVETDAILNLHPILQGDPHGIVGDFYPHILEAFTWCGQIWGVPADVDPWVLYYNKDLFDQANVPYPEPEWTWNEFLEKATLLTVEGASHTQYGFGSNPKEAPEIIAFIYQHGGSLVDSFVDPKTPTFDSPATIEAVEWYANLSLEYGVMTPPEVIEHYRRAGAFEAAMREQVAMWMGPLSIRGGTAWRYEWPFNWGVVPLPRDQQQATLFVLTGYFITSRSPHPREAWLWIEEITGSPRPAWNLPPRRSVAEMPSYRQRVGEEVADAALYSSECGLTSSPTPWLMEVFDWFSQALTAILTGEQTVEAAMQELQRQAEAALAAQELSQ